MQPGSYGQMLDRSGFVLEFDEEFRGGQLDPRRWVARDLPQWTTPDRAAARFDLDPGVLRLRLTQCDGG